MNAILDLKQTRHDIRGRLEARRRELEEQLRADGWGNADTAPAMTESDRRVQALATGQPYEPKPEVNRAELSRELNDVRRALKKHEVADALATLPELRATVEATLKDGRAIVKEHVAGLKALAASEPALDAFVDASVSQHNSRMWVAEVARQAGEQAGPLDVPFDANVEDACVRLREIARLAGALVASLKDLGIK